MVLHRLKRYVSKAKADEQGGAAERKAVKAGGLPIYSSVKGQCNLRGDVIRKAAAEAGATDEQKEILKAFREICVSELVDHKVLKHVEDADGGMSPRGSASKLKDGAMSRTDSKDAPASSAKTEIELMLEDFDPRHCLLVSSDMNRIEVRVSPQEQQKDQPKQNKKEIETLAKEFMEEVGMPDNMLEKTLGHLKWAKNVGLTTSSGLAAGDLAAEATHIELWCVLDHIRDRSQGEPSADAGFTVWWMNHRLSWSAADMLLPGSDDKDTFVEFCMRENPPLMPSSYTASFFESMDYVYEDESKSKGHKKEEEQKEWKPVHWERGLQMELPPSPQAAFLGLMVFKAMGFIKPDDELFKALIKIDQRGAFVGAKFGPDGLTRMFIRLYRTPPGAAKELADLLDLHYDVKMLGGFDETTGKWSGICESVNAAPEVIEYAAEARGFTVSVGFVA